MFGPKEARMWFMKGVMLTYLERYGEAILNFEKALELNPNHRMARTFKIDTHKKLNEM